MRYLVNEVYSCLQGEGPNIGVPAILVRFQICNLRCEWCDTPFTHTLSSDPQQRNSKGRDGRTRIKQNFRSYSCEELAHVIRHQPGDIKHLILSGGEPTLHNFLPLVQDLGKEYTAEVETNGTVIPHRKHPGFSLADYERFQWNISPKGNNAGCDIVRDSLDFWSGLCRDRLPIFFKWVVRSAVLEQDLHEIMGLVESFRIPRESVLLMPEGTTPESQLNSQRLAEACIQLGMRMSPRLHVILYGDKRGY